MPSDVSMEQQSPVDDKKLDQLLSEADVPTLPMVAQKLVELCRDENANFADFARVIEADPGLASRLLRVANSAYYGLRHKASTLERAITALGLKYVKSVSLGFHLATALNKFGASGIDMEDFWRHSVLRAVLARQLANHYCSARCQEAFLIGLLQDCGIPFLVQALGQEYAKLWHNTNNNSQASLYLLEHELFPFDHLAAAGIITQQWGLPKLLAHPICVHHCRSEAQPSTDEEVQLSQIAYFVGTLSLNGPESLSEEDITLLDYAHTTFGLSGKDLNKILEKTSHEFSGVSKLFGNILPDQVDIAKLLSQTNNLLSGLANDANRKIFDFESEMKEFKSYCDSLTNSVAHYRQQAQTDPLTGLATRDVLTGNLEEACQSLRSGQASLAVLFIDIDNFKEVNDRYGHSAGDRLLKEFARMLQERFGNTGCVARYGGDEFVVGLSGVRLDQAVLLTKNLLEKIHNFSLSNVSQIPPDGAVLSCSIGMVFYEAGASPAGAAGILELADHQMYLVKDNGKNNLSYQVINSL